MILDNFWPPFWDVAKNIETQSLSSGDQTHWCRTIAFPFIGPIWTTI